MEGEQDEMMLLERVFLRIGSAETDEQLEANLNKFLAPVLLKLASQQEGVRKKVMELLVHINKRVKSRPLVQLPVKTLLSQYQDPTTPAFVTNFTVIYLKLGYPRLDAEQKVALLPMLINCLENKPVAQKDSLLNLIVPVLQHLKLSAGSTSQHHSLKLEGRPDTCRLLLDYMLDVLLLPYSPGASTSAPPPGMSASAYKRVTGEGAPSPDELEQIKLGIIRFLGSELFKQEDAACLYVVATADARHSVASAADLELKRGVTRQDWNNSKIVTKLYSLFQGTVNIKGKAPSNKPERSPGSLSLRMKIFPYLLKSEEAANHFPASVQVVFDCLYGTNTNAKLRVMAVQLVHHLCLYCKDVKLKPVGPVLLSGMIKLIDEAREDSKLKSLAYVAVGKIGKRIPEIVSKDIALLQKFFEALCQEDMESRLAVQEALSMMTEAYQNVDDTSLNLLEALIMQNIEKQEPQARLMAVQYAKSVFPGNHIPSRYVLLLACGDVKEEIYQEASKSLRNLPKPDDADDNTAAKDTAMDLDQKPLLPKFPEMVQYIHDKATQRIKSSNKFVMGNNVLAFNPGTYGEILMYMRMCLAYGAGVIPNLESTAEMQAQAPFISKYVNKLLEEQEGEKGPISVYIGIIRQLLTAIGGAPAMYCLLEVVAVAQQKLAPHMIKHLDWIKNFMFSSREEMREFASQLYAVTVATNAESAQLLQIMQELTTNIKNQAPEGQHGSVLAIGYLQGFLGGKARLAGQDMSLEDMETDATDQTSKVTKKATVEIVKLLENSQVQLAVAACTALGEMGRNGPLCLPPGEPKGKEITKQTLVDSLVKIVQTTSANPKLREKSAVCLGQLCVGEKGFPHTQRAMQGLMDCAQPKQLELHFTVGESLVTAAQGSRSPAARDTWLQTEQDIQVSEKEDPENMNWLLEQLLSKYCRSPNPHIKQAACVWLLSVAKLCGKYQNLQAKLKHIQLAFMNMLKESDELTQDIASKGLGVVYEECGPEQKKELVDMLMETLMTGKSKVQVTTGDSKVFEEGALGKTPEGQGMSTYKELCSIANDLNQPDLIYKFMHLANHNAMWNSRKGAAFGFSTIAAQAGEQLAPHMQKIVPKLYRYQFDPNRKVQQAMAGIWAALVKDPQKTVDQYIKEITEDLLQNLTSNQWRIRESSCQAVNDLLRGRQLDDIIHLLPQLWEVLFRVRDDIKESVRNMADIAIRTLSRVSIKICDPNYGKTGSQATSAVLPCILKSGLTSQVDVVRALSLQTLLKISKNAGSLLRPHIPLLVVALLESLSTLEPQMLNYLALRVGQEGQERLDSARVAASKTSPMMEVVNMSVQYVDAEVLTELMPRLLDLAKSSVGLGTKAGCANLIVSLTHQCQQDIQPYAGKILAALLNGLNDRNSVVKKAYASAMGHVVKVAKDSSVEKLIQRLREWYLTKDDESMKGVCGVALQAINQHSPDTLKRHAATALPLAFFAMHEKQHRDAIEKEGKVSVWEEVWLEVTPGTEAGIRLYLKELVELTKLALDSQSWHTKAQGAATMSTIANRLGANLGPPHLGMLLTALVAGLAGRTWTGKEVLLQATSAVCVSCKDLVQAGGEEGQPESQQVVDVLMRECRKENPKYKLAALTSTGPVLETLEVDCYQEVLDIVVPILRKGDGDKDDDTDKDTELNLQMISYDMLGQTWPKETKTQNDQLERTTELLLNGLSHGLWKIDLAALRATQKVLERLSHLQSKDSITANAEKVKELMNKLLPHIGKHLGTVKYSSVRTAALSNIEAILKKLSDAGQTSLVSEASLSNLKGHLKEMIERENQPDLKDRASDLLMSVS